MLIFFSTATFQFCISLLQHQVANLTHYFTAAIFRDGSFFRLKLVFAKLYLMFHVVHKLSMCILLSVSKLGSECPIKKNNLENFKQ